MLSLNIVFLATFFLYTVLTAKQELHFYTPNNGIVIIDQHYRDLSNFSSVLDRSNRVCGYGPWGLYNTLDFSTMPFGGGQHYGEGQNMTCYNATDIRGKKSIRYFGARDTLLPAISFYAEEWFVGQEFFVNTTAAGNISYPQKSYHTTGRSSWTFFEGSNYDGRATCVRFLGGIRDYSWNQNFTGVVGSVKLGCES